MFRLQVVEWLELSPHVEVGAVVLLVGLVLVRIVAQPAAACRIQGEVARAVSVEVGVLVAQQERQAGGLECTVDDRFLSPNATADASSTSSATPRSC